ncbi:hypothetical protein D3C76_368800 [compost metagenome]
MNTYRNLIDLGSYQKGVMNLMDNKCKLSHVTQAYLNTYYTALHTMIRRMTRVPLLCSISDTFIQQMIPHHLAANKSISNVQAIQCTCRILTNTGFERAEYMKRFEKIAQTMFAAMGAATVTNGVNANFVREMIPHHEGAVRMSNHVLQFKICPELKPILYAIITTQCEGIKQIKKPTKSTRSLLR